MLDQLSRGRFELGVGRGISPIETAYYGVNPDHRQKMYLETLQILRQALTSRTLTFHGEFYDYADVPMELEPFQKPHPPFWSGAGTPDGGESAGRIGFNLVANALTAQVRTITDRYRAAFKGTHTPLLGLARFVIMGETDDEALTIARRAYPLWHRHFHHLFHMHGTSPAGGDRPPQFDQIKDGGRGIAGSPATVTRMIKSQMEEAGTNYFVGQFAFGDLTLAGGAAHGRSVRARGHAGASGHAIASMNGNCAHRTVRRRASLAPAIAAIRTWIPPPLTRSCEYPQDRCDAALRPHCSEFHPGRSASLHRTTGRRRRIQPFQLVTRETNARYDIFTNLPATLQARCTATSGCRL